MGKNLIDNDCLKYIFVIIIIFILYYIWMKCINKNNMKGGKVKLDNIINDDNDNDIINTIQDIDKKIKIDKKNIEKREQKIINTLQHNKLSNKIDKNKELNRILNYKKINFEDLDDYNDKDIEIWNAEIDKFMPSNKEFSEWEELFEKTITISENSQKGGDEIKIPEIDKIEKKMSKKIESINKILS